MKSEFRSQSVVSNFLDVVGDKWSLIIIRDLFLQRNTFSQLLKGSGENISTNILTDRLKKLKKYDIINHVKDRNDKKVKHYYLTDKGVELRNVIFEMALWSAQHLNQKDEHSQIFIQKTKKTPKEQMIMEGKLSYVNKREALLNYHNAIETHEIDF